MQICSILQDSGANINRYVAQQRNRGNDFQELRGFMQIDMKLVQ